MQPGISAAPASLLIIAASPSSPRSRFDRVTVAVRRDVGRLIARGNTSDVYEWTPETVVKVLRPQIPAHWASTEAKAMGEAREVGLPVPAVRDIVSIRHRRGIVMERIVGETLAERMMTRPDESDRWMEMLVELQQEVSRVSGIGALRSLKERLGADIVDARAVSNEDRTRLLELLDGLPDKRSMCHFDFHPGNVIVGPQGPVIIDWFDAGAGDPAADLVRTAMLLRYGAANSYGPDMVAMMARVHRDYLAHMARHPDFDIDSLVAWEPVVMGARLAEPIPNQLFELTRRDLDRALAGDSQLHASLRDCRVAA